MRRRNAAQLTKALSRMKSITPPKPPRDYYHIYQMYTVRMKEGKGARGKLASHLGEMGVSSKVYFYPVHLTHFYRTVLKYRCKLPVTEEVCQQVLSLPIYPSMTTKEIRYITDGIESFQKVGKK
jgi:perosamine synthetase